MVRRRAKSVRKNRSIAKERESDLNDQPHTFVFSRPGVGSLVKRLALDLRSAFEPFTATNVRFRRKNVIKDFVAIAGTFHVTHALYLTHSRPKELPQLEAEESLSTATPGQGGVMLHVLRLPHGPSLTLKVVEYSLMRDVLTLVRRIGRPSQYQAPPLLVMQGFSGEGKHLQLMTSVFRNMLPPIVISKVKVKNIRRVLLLSREEDASGDGNDVIHLRHFTIRTETKGLSRAVRKVKTGRKRVPNLSKYARIEDFIIKAGMLSDSGLSENDADGPENEVELDRESGLSHVAPGKASIRLTEIGPRISLQLVKIEEGLNSGSVLYHRWVHKTPEERRLLEERQTRRAKDKQTRKATQEANRKRNLASVEEHKQRCLEGMKGEGEGQGGEEGAASGGDDDGSYHGGSSEEEERERTERTPRIKSMKRRSSAGSDVASGRGKRSRTEAESGGGGTNKGDRDGGADKAKKVTVADLIQKRKANQKKRAKQKIKKRKVSKKRGRH